MRLLKLYSQNKHLKAENERLKADLAALQPVKRLDAPDLEFAFKDTEGIPYYRIPATLAMPLERHGKAQEYVMFMRINMSPEIAKKLTTAGKKATDELAADRSLTPSKVYAVFEAMDQMIDSGMVMHTELLYNFLAVHRIRYDEPVAQFSQEIQSEKVEAFKKIVKEAGTSYPFFQVPELQSVNATLNLSESEWNEFWNQSLLMQQQQREMVKYLMSVVKSRKEKKTATIL